MVRRAVWKTLYADDVCIVPWSQQGLERMLSLLVAGFEAFRLCL